MLFHSTSTLVELPPEEIANLSDASLNVGGTVLLYLHCNVCTTAVEFHAHRLARGPIALFGGNVSLGNQLGIVRRHSLERTRDLRTVRSNPCCVRSAMFRSYSTSRLPNCCSRRTKARSARTRRLT